MNFKSDFHEDKYHIELLVIGPFRNKEELILKIKEAIRAKISKFKKIWKIEDYPKIKQYIWDEVQMYMVYYYLRKYDYNPDLDHPFTSTVFNELTRNVIKDDKEICHLKGIKKIPFMGQSYIIIQLEGIVKTEEDKQYLDKMEQAGRFKEAGFDEQYKNIEQEIRGYKLSYLKELI
jgi:hypothetical protein